MRTYKHITTRLLPKTQQIVSYVDNDDGDLQRGWWKNESTATNRTRFKALVFDGYDFTLDEATGLLWPKNYNQLGGNNGNLLNFEDALEWAENLDFGGFTDWHLPNINELWTLMNWNEFQPMLDTDWFNFYEGVYVSSTTNTKYLTDYMKLSLYQGYCTSQTKTIAAYVIAVRDYK